MTGKVRQAKVVRRARDPGGPRRRGRRRQRRRRGRLGLSWCGTRPPVFGDSGI